MALVTYPLNNIEYSAEDAELFHVTRTSGIYAKDSFGYSITGTDNNIVIGTGIGWIKNGEFSGKVVAQKEPISLNMGLPDPVYPSIDAIVIQFDANKNETNIVVKKGVAATSPVAPSVVRTESVYELHLYHVRREAGSLYIAAGNITDLRLNSSYCGLMADSVTKIDTAAIEKQVEELIESLRGYIPPIESSDNPGCYYKLVDGEKEWLNPPMVRSTEYRTTERNEGKPVYSVKVSLGTMVADGEVQIPIKAGTALNILRFSGQLVSNPLPNTLYGAWMDVQAVNASTMLIRMHTDEPALVGSPVYVSIWYTKD